MGHKEQAGFSILEVLIFIAVSSLMFISAIAVIGGRQRQVQFAQGTREFDAKLRDIINDVTTGYYPSNETVSCEVGVDGEVNIQSGTDQKIGENSVCIYVGKVIQFQPDGDESMIRIYSMAGRRFSDSESSIVTTIDQANPKAVALPGVVTFTKTSQDHLLLYGLKVTRVFRPISSSVFTDYGAVAIMSNFGGSSVSEAQSVEIGGIVGSEMGSNEDSALSTINQLTDLSSQSGSVGYMEKNTEEGVVICLESSDGRKSSLSFGVKNSAATVLKIDGYNAGCDQ